MPAAVAIGQVLQQEARRGIAVSPAQGSLAADSNTADLQTAMRSIHFSLFFNDYNTREPRPRIPSSRPVWTTYQDSDSKINKTKQDN